MSNKRRIGKFFVDFSIVERREIFPVLIKMEFVPMRVEALFFKRQFEYIGSSPFFDKLKEGVEVPLYDIIVNDLGSELKVSVKTSMEGVYTVKILNGEK